MPRSMLAASLAVHRVCHVPGSAEAWRFARRRTQLQRGIRSHGSEVRLWPSVVGGSGRAERALRVHWWCMPRGASRPARGRPSACMAAAGVSAGNPWRCGGDFPACMQRQRMMVACSQAAVLTCITVVGLFVGRSEGSRAFVGFDRRAAGVVCSRELGRVQPARSRGVSKMGTMM